MSGQVVPARAGENAAVELAADNFMEAWAAWIYPAEDNERDGNRMRELLGNFAEAVRAEERERIAQAIESHCPDVLRGDLLHATRPMLERNQALRDAYRYAARLARGSS